MSVKSKRFQKYQPSKLNNKKNVCFSSETDVFFDRSTLTAGIFENTGSSETLCTSFERSNQCAIGATKVKSVTPLLLWATSS